METEKAVASRPADVSPQEAKPTVFKPSETFCGLSSGLKSLGKFIRNGLVGDVRSDGPKTHRYVLINNNREYLPNLVKQIIQDHIVPSLTYGSDEERDRIIQQISVNYNPKATGLSEGAFFALRGKIRRLEPATIMEVTKEVMKLI